jgi:hypothetical protein
VQALGQLGQCCFPDGLDAGVGRGHAVSPSRRRTAVVVVLDARSGDSTGP